MALNNDTSSVSLVGTGSASIPYQVPFEFLANEDLSVYVKTAGVITQLSYTNGQYTVTGAGNPSGGTVSTTTAVPTTSTVYISRTVALTQKTSFITGDRFPSQALERALDKVTMICQQLQRLFIKGIRFSDASPDQPALSPQSNSILGFDSGGVVTSFTSNNLTGTFPFVLGVGSQGATPAWVSQTAAGIADGAITTAKLASASVTPAKLSSAGNITWDTAGNLTATSYSGNLTGNATTASTAAAVTAGSVTPAGLSGAVGANAWVSKTANYTAVIGDRIEADTTSGTFIITLPASPTLGSMVTFADAARTWATNNLTVARNGNTIEAISEDLVCNVSGKRIAAVYNGNTWRIY